MERSKRKWEFKWHGVNIAAPIKDPQFFDDFAPHNFTIVTGRGHGCMRFELDPTLSKITV